MIDRRELLARYAYAASGDWSATARFIREKPDVSGIDVNEPYITIYDTEYPSALRELRFPPWVLFYQGDISLMKMNAATVVGSRNMGRYGAIATEAVVEHLADRFVIVSGLAKGVDACAHAKAISMHARTIGVIGSGLKTHYPAVNERLYRRMSYDQLILSEYPWETGIRREHFPWRNRILAALGQVITVTQAAMRSGTMLTVNEAISLSREVYCIPYPMSDESGSGCNLLIQQGANILYNLDLLDDLQPWYPEHSRLQKRTDVAYPNGCSSI